jgi:hypothetical protein
MKRLFPKMPQIVEWAVFFIALPIAAIGLVVWIGWVLLTGLIRNARYRKESYFDPV